MTKEGNGPGGRKVGKGNPPPEHQWSKGTSGNPKGRPKKVAAEPLDLDFVEMILAEGSRKITLNEDGKPVSMAMVQAVYRWMPVAALKGNSHAARTYVQNFANAKAQQQKRKDEAIATAFVIKIQLEQKRVEWVADGHEEMTMAVHPSDIEIDCVTGQVKYFLAWTQEDRDARAKAVKLRDYLLEQIARSFATAAADGDDSLLQTSRKCARAAVLAINEHLPSRFRQVPPGDGPTVGPDSSPEEIWRAMMRPLVDLVTGRSNQKSAESAAQ